LITGVSSGFGRLLAELLLARGDRVAGTLRKATHVAEFEQLAPGRAHGILLDVADGRQAQPAIDQVITCLGGIDVLVNNAGYGLFGALEETSDDEAMQLMQTNFFGLLRLTRAVLPQMRAQGHGRIVNLSSMAGMIGIPGGSLYSASKFAVEGLSDALAAELSAFNIQVMIVEPGGYRTQFAGSSLNLTAHSLPAYAETPAGNTRKLMQQYAGHEPGDPRLAMQVLIDAIEVEKPPMRLVLGADAIKAVQYKLSAIAADIEAWRGPSAATVFKS